MPTIQIGQYTRPGIYINEYDNSILPNIVAPAGNYTLVIGFSKIGPINTPVLLQSQSDLTNIFGNIDRTLERNGSFFHRTIQQMLLSGPVYALNLLETDDTLDLLQYASLSAACNYPNYINSNGAPYSKFFNTTGFWKKDTESFNYLANVEPNGSTDGNNHNRLFNVTNMSGNYVTLFIYKTQTTSYNNSLINYYGSVENIPPYLKATDWASDYMVDVLAVSGDWSNYASLSVDPRWNKYFDGTGLKKGQLSNFAADRNISVLSFYSNLSFIPYFTDLSGNNLFIETVLNNDFAKTGLYCAFNMDLYETAFANGLVDLVGNSIDSTNSIDFLSYKDTIVENVEFENTVLNRAGNVFGIDISGGQRGTDTVNDRDFDYSEGIVRNITLGSTPSSYIKFNGLTTISSPTTGYFPDITSSGFTYSIGLTAGLTASINVINYGTSVVINTNYVGTSSIGIDGTTVSIPSTSFGATATATASALAYINISGLTYSGLSYSYFNLTSAAPGLTIGFTLSSTTASTASTAIAADIVKNWNLSYGTSSGYTMSTIGATISLGYTNGGTAANGYTFSIKISKGVTASIFTSGTFSGGSAYNALANPLILSLKYPTLYTPVTYVIGSMASAVSNGIFITFSEGNYSFSIDPMSYTSDGLYQTAIVLNNSGINAIRSTVPGKINPPVQPTDIVLGYMNYTIKNSEGLSSLTFSNVTVDTNGFVELQNGTDFLYSLSNGVLGITFSKTAGTPNVNDYATYRKIKAFNYLLSIVSSSNFTHGAFLYTTGPNAVVKSTSNMSLASYTNNNLTDRYIAINTNLTGTSLNQIVFYIKDDEFIIGRQGFKTSETDPISATGYGSVRYQSTFYKDYYNGVINTGDYFYDNLISGTTTSVVFSFVNGTNYVKFSNPNLDLTTGDTLLVPDSTSNKFEFTKTGDPISATYGYVIDTGLYNVTDEIITSTNRVYKTDPDNTHYLQMEFSGNLLNVTFTDTDKETPKSIILDLPTLLDVTSYDGEYKESVEIKSVINANTVAVDGSRYSNILAGDFLSAYYDETMLEVGEVPKKITRILTKKVNPSDNTQVLLSCDSKIDYKIYNGIKQTTRYSSIDNYATTYKGIVLKGFRMRNASMPDGTEARQSLILDLVGKGTPLFTALSNKDAIDFRYLVDSFGLGLTEYSKQQLVDLCGERLDCFGFLNMPSMKQFKQSASPTFIDANGVLQTSYIAAGGNLDKNPAFLYSFGIGRGTTCVGYFTPYVTVSDNGRPFNVPPAMFVATTYMKKINANSSSITPWTIAAGITNGKISGFGKTEIDFTPQDISNLNTAQINPIVYKKNRGYVIETENTAQTEYKSSLSYIHCREVLVELERDLSAMLLDFQWKYNTTQTRAEIKQRADSICSTYVSKNGLYNYFNKCDQENNTQIIIDNQIGVLDTYVEIIKGMGVIVNNITILKTGAIASGGFQ
jgi:hypothetical protein